MVSNDNAFGINWTEERMGESFEYGINWTRTLNIHDPNIVCAWILLIIAIAVVCYIFLRAYSDKKNPQPEVKETRKKTGMRK